MTNLFGRRRGTGRGSLVDSASGQNVLIVGRVDNLGVQNWKPSDKEIAIQVINRLEDCRALFNDYEIETPDYVIKSICDLRSVLKDKLDHVAGQNGVAKQIKAMLAACRKFLDNSVDNQRIAPNQAVDAFRGGIDTWKFCAALGELRASFGVALALMLNAYGLTCEPDLARVLPADASQTV